MFTVVPMLEKENGRHAPQHRFQLHQKVLLNQPENQILW